MWWKCQVLKELESINHHLLELVKFQKAATRIYFKSQGVNIKGVKMKINQLITVTAVPFNAPADRPGTIDSPITWEVSDANLASIVPSDDTLTAVVKSLNAGTVIVKATAISNGNTIEGSLTVVIDAPVQNFATEIRLSASDPVDAPSGV